MSEKQKTKDRLQQGLSLFLLMLVYMMLFLGLNSSISHEAQEALLPLTGSQSLLMKKKVSYDVKEDICGKTTPVRILLDKTSDQFLDYLPKTIYYKNDLIPYENVGEKNGQKWIDTHRYESAATWSGQVKFNGADGLNTHFIGHNPGIFQKIMKMKIGEQILVTDENGTMTQYAIQKIAYVNHAGYEEETNTDLLPQITGKDGGERITLQACYNDKINFIVFAYRSIR
jgi:hypothetical protein